MRKTKFSTRIFSSRHKLYHVLFLCLVTTLSYSSLSAQCSMSCKSVNISIGSSEDPDDPSRTICDADISPNDLLTEECMDADSYIIIIKDHHGVALDSSSNLLFEENFMWQGAGSQTGEEVQIEIQAIAMDGSILNTCWNFVLIEDKRPPSIDCSPTTTTITSIKCCEAGNLPMALMREAVDECSEFKLVIVTQDDRPANCSDDEILLTRIIDVRAFAVDKFGNQSNPCDFRVEVERLFPELTMDMNNAPVRDSTNSLLDSTLLVCPDTFSFQNGNAFDCTDLADKNLIELATAEGIILVPGPFPVSDGGAGLPFLVKDTDSGMGVVRDTTLLYPMDSRSGESVSLLTNCNVGVIYTDLFLGRTGCITKVMRSFSIREWHCSGERTILCNQVIEIADTTAPVVLDSFPDFEVSTNGYDCLGTFTLPETRFEDGCGIISHVDVIYPTGVLKNFQTATANQKRISVPEGEHDVIYRGFDLCHNFTDDTIRVSVWDNTPPVAICDNNLVISISNSGSAEVHASSFDDGSYDDCKLKSVLVRKMNPDGCDCEEHPPVLDHFTSLGIFKGHYYYLSTDSVIYDKAINLSIAHGGYLSFVDGNGNFNVKTKAGRDSIRLEADWLDMRVEAFKGSPAPDYWMSVDGIIDVNGQKPDSLTGTRKYYIIEIENPCGFSSKVNFCCNDLANDETMVVVRAIDKWGNFNECMISATLQDKTVPVLECPPSLQVACEFEGVDINNLSAVFGEIVQGGPIDALTPGFTLTGSGTTAANFIAIYPGRVGESKTVPDSIKGILKFSDGYVLGNCTGRFDIVELIDDDRDQCGRGPLLREFFIDTDLNGVLDRGEASCKQLLDFIATDTFNLKTINQDRLRDTVLNILVAADTIFCLDDRNNTENQFPSSAFGEPTFPGEDQCDLIGIQYEDQVFESRFDMLCDASTTRPTDYCYKVIRTFTVINWCNLNQRNPGVFEDRVELDPQVIYVIDSIAPTILQPDSTKHKFCSFDPNCGLGTVMLEYTGMGNSVCSNNTDLKWVFCIEPDENSIVDNPQDLGALSGTVEGPVLTLVGNYPVGKHILNLALYDECGNVDHRIDTIVVENCKAPTAYCINGLAVDLMDNGMVELWASDFTLPVDAACPGFTVELSFEKDSFEPNKTFDCDDFNDSPVFVDIYFTALDSDGNRNSHGAEGAIRQSFCTTSLSVQDNGNNCPAQNGNGAAISGFVSRADNASISDVEVNLEGGNIDAAMTDGEGYYAFPNMPLGGQYIIAPAKADSPIEGVTTLDIVLIQKHILGSRLLDSPYKMIAADINADKKVSALDILSLRKLILGVDKTFQNNTVWNFVDKEYQFFDADRPLSENYGDKYAINELNNSMDIHFVGVKTGDINFSAAMSGMRTTETRSSQTLALHVDHLELPEANLVRIPVMSAQDQQVSGYQFTMEYDQTALKLVSVLEQSIDMSMNNFGIHSDAGKVTVSWNNGDDYSLVADEPLFTLEFERISADAFSDDLITISSSITAAEAYSDDQVMEVVLLDKEFQSIEQLAVLHQNTPNPFSAITQIGFDMPQAGNATLTVHSLTGQVLRAISGSYAKGYNELTISKQELDYSGVLYYTLVTNGQSMTKQMIIIE